MRTQDQAWTILQLEHLRRKLRDTEDQHKETIRQISELIDQLDRRFDEAITRERLA